MPNTITSTMQTNIKAAFVVLRDIHREFKDIYDSYWKSDANTTISALQETDPVTVSTKLTKAEFVNGVTLSENLNKFFTNQAVATADYLAHCQNIKYGNDPATSVLSQAVEKIGERLYDGTLQILTAYEDAKNILDSYSNNQIDDIVTAFDNQRVIPGMDATKDDLNLAATLLEQFKKMIENSAVTTGDYGSTLSKWERF